MLKDISAGFVELKREECIDTIKARIDKGEETLKIMEEARKAMTAVGDQFHVRNPYLAEMLLAAEIFTEAVEILKPHMNEARPANTIGKIVLVTPKGDIHYLGVDVDSLMIVKKVREIKTDLVGFSALITTAFASMKQLTENFCRRKPARWFQVHGGRRGYKSNSQRSP